MKNSSIIFITIAVVVLAVGSFFFFSQKSPSGQTNTTTSLGVPAPGYKGVKEMIVNEDAANNSQYIDYYDGIIEEYKGKRRAIYFYANWCPTCQPVDRELKQTDELPADVIVIKVHYNDTDTTSEHKALAQKYGITYQHSFVILDENEEAITAWNGGGLKELLKRI